MKRLKAADILKLINFPTASGAEVYALKQRLIRQAPVQELMRALRQSQAPDVRQFLCYVLGDTRARSAGPVLVECLNDRSPVVRDCAAEAVAKLGYARAGATLLKRLDIEPNIGIQRRLLVALGAVGYSSAIPVLIGYLKSRDEAMRGCAAWSLGALKAAEAVDALELALAREKKPYPHTRIKEALAVIKGQIAYDRHFVPVRRKLPRQ